MEDFMEIWEILGLEPTEDISAIKLAYAQKTKTCHPEENPEGFLKLRKAYQAAVSYAERGSAPLTWEQDKTEKAADEETHSKEIYDEEMHDKQIFEEQALDDWTISDNWDETTSNPFRDGEAIGQFMALYTGKQRKNPKLWMEYFTSDAFLEAAWDSRFTALLSEKITEVEQDFPLNKELMMWLCIVYQIFPNTEVEQEYMFDGIEPILLLAAKGPAPKRAGGDELAVLESFKDYRHLVRMADSGSWNEQAMTEFQWIIGRYSSAYIKDRCDANATPDYQRHPAGLRILTHFFQREDLPGELYRIVWQKYDLKNAVLGRMKIFYGPLRELVVQRLSGIEEEAVENFFHLNEERAAFFTRIKENPDRAEGETAAFFAQKNVQNALRSRRFIEEQLLSCSNWLNTVTPEIVVCWLQTFYSGHQDIPGWKRVVERTQQELDYRLEAQNRKAQEENAVPEKPDLSLLMTMPNRVYAQPLTGAERFFQTDNDRQNSMNGKPWEEDWGGGDNENAEPLTEECLTALFDEFAEGALTRLELQFSKMILALVRDGDKYAGFCFDENDSTWFSMLSQPEVYQTVDCEDVAYFPFGMGKLASYNIHESPASIMRNLNLVFMQIGRGRIQVRVGDCWLWSSHTNRHNGLFKTRMAMQKLAKIPVRNGNGYLMDKFVFSQCPVCAERVSLSGERAFIQIKPGSSDLAVGALMQFFGKKLARLRLSWELKGRNAQNGKAYQQHIILLQDSGQFMMAWLRDDNEQAVFYASDTPRIFLGRVYPACLVHQDLVRIRNCLDWILEDIACAELVTDRPGEFVAADCPYHQIRKELLDDTQQESEV